CAGSATWRGSSGLPRLNLPGANMAIQCARIEGGARAMMSFFVCAGLLGLLAVALLSNVGRVRGKTKIFIGDGGNTELITAMRAQANFVENVPLGLILIWLVGTFYGAATVATLSVLLVVARLLHATGMLGYLPHGRAAGATITLLVLVVASIWVGLAGLGVKLY